MATTKEIARDVAVVVAEKMTGDAFEISVADFTLCCSQYEFGGKMGSVIHNQDHLQEAEE